MYMSQLCLSKCTNEEMLRKIRKYRITDPSTNYMPTKTINCAASLLKKPSLKGYKYYNVVHNIKYVYTFFVQFYILHFMFINNCMHKLYMYINYKKFDIRLTS